MTTMADLTDGVRVLHAPNAAEGTITVDGYRIWVRWDGEPGRYRVSKHGQVYPADLVIIGGAS